MHSTDALIRNWRGARQGVPFYSSMTFADRGWCWAAIQRLRALLRVARLLILPAMKRAFSLYYGAREKELEGYALGVFSRQGEFLFGLTDLFRETAEKE
jgi:hypothetical protein